MTSKKRIDECLTAIINLCEDSSDARQNKILALAQRALEIQREVNEKLAIPGFREEFKDKLDERFGNNKAI